jgi:hypothetical protein
MDLFNHVQFSYTSLALAVASIAAAYVFYCLYLHPLARAGVPGPWYAAIGSFWDEWQQFALCYSRAIERLHNKYGPVVRIGVNKVGAVPSQNEVDLACSRATRSRLSTNRLKRSFMAPAANCLATCTTNVSSLVAETTP